MLNLYNRRLSTEKSTGHHQRHHHQHLQSSEARGGPSDRTSGDGSVRSPAMKPSPPAAVTIPALAGRARLPIRPLLPPPPPELFFPVISSYFEVVFNRPDGLGDSVPSERPNQQPRPPPPTAAVTTSPLVVGRVRSRARTKQQDKCITTFEEATMPRAPAPVVWADRETCDNGLAERLRSVNETSGTVARARQQEAAGECADRHCSRVARGKLGLPGPVSSEWLIKKVTPSALHACFTIAPRSSAFD
jgi:hypothetical protein